MHEFSFQRFIDLVEFDQATRKLEKEQEQIQNSIAHARHEIAQLNDHLQQIDQRLKQAKLTVKEKENHMQSLDDQQKQKEHQLDRVSNQREYQSLYAEIEKLKNKQHAFEQEVVDAWTSLENVTREAKNIHQELNKKIEEINSAIESQKKASDNLENSIKERLTNRESMLATVPPELLEKYDAMRPRIINPIVPVYHGSCSACFATVPQITMARLRSKVLEQCKGCFRFLYLGSP